MDQTEPASQTYSQRLGVLTPDQFQLALTRFDLGEFIEATPVTSGLFGQNVFVTSTHGEYVLRGAPHFPWQFPKERFGAMLLHERTQVPVAFPYLLDTSTDIFGWPYLLMPRLQGIHPASVHLTDAERIDIAHALGENLARLHGLTWPFAGGYDLATDTIQPFDEGFAEWISADVRRWLAVARKSNATTDEDVLWIEQILLKAHPALTAPFQPCFVMNDYNPGNLLVARVQGKWQVSAIFDLMEYYFGDGEADLVRLIATYLDRSEQSHLHQATAFVTSYLAQRPPRSGFAERFELYMLRDRLIVWEYGTRPENNWFAMHPSFRSYAERYVQSWHLIVPDAA